MKKKHNPDEIVADIVVLKLAKYKGYPILIRKFYDYFEYVLFLDGKYFSDSLLITQPEGGFTKLQCAQAADILFEGGCLTINEARGEQTDLQEHHVDTPSNQLH